MRGTFSSALEGSRVRKKNIWFLLLSKRTHTCIHLGMKHHMSETYFQMIQQILASIIFDQREKIGGISTGNSGRSRN